MEKRFLGIIPARYASTRFPGKPLVMLGNKPMIQWVWERAGTCFPDLVVATDDDRILETVRAFGGRTVMTSPAHGSGTERCAEALEITEREQGESFSHVVNIQGDEPLVSLQQLNLLKTGFNNPGCDIATLVHALEDPADYENPNVVKVVRDAHERALYFSRAPIPHHRDGEFTDGQGQGICLRHIGLYAYRAEVLRELVQLNATSLEQLESLEQLRWLYHGYHIRTLLTDEISAGVDTPEDLEKLSSLIG